MAGQDIMHLEGGGTIPKEKKDMMYNHIVIKELYTLEHANKALRKLKEKYPSVVPSPPSIRAF